MKKYTQLFLSVIFILLLGIVSAKAQQVKSQTNGELPKTPQNESIIKVEKNALPEKLKADSLAVPNTMAKGDSIKIAKPLNMDEVKKLISYPILARDNNIQGQVMTQIFVDENGNYIKHIILKSPHKFLTEGVEKYISKLRFSPALKNGEPIQSTADIPFNFQLGGLGTKKPKQK